MLKFKGRKARRDDSVMVAPTAAPTHAAHASPAPTPRASDLTVGDYANGVPNIRLGAMFGSFLRQLVWVFPLFLMGCAAAWFLTADFKRTYTGEGTIMVQLGDEYVYQPIAGTQAQSSLMQTPDTITLNELAILKNPEVMDEVIGRIAERPGGLAAFDRRIAAKMAAHSQGSEGYRLAYMELRKKMDASFGVSARPRSSIIDLSFKHSDPELAVWTLNALMDAYMDYRRSLFVDGAGEVIAQRRQDTEDQLRANERRMARFLSKNGISAFASEQGGASKRTEDLRASLNTLRAQIVETERSLASVEDQLRQTPGEINLYVDDRASNRIAQAELELKQLLAKYLPNSDPVRQKQLEIQELRSLQQASNGAAMGGRRVGPNPVYQDLMRSRNTLAAAADSLREREVVVHRQLTDADAKLRRMTSLMPGYNEILRERETLDTRLKTYLNKEQEALINQQRAEDSAENVKVISTATYPIRGRNMRMLAFVGASAAWGFTLFMLALFRVFLDPRLYATAPSHTSYAPSYAPRQANMQPPAAPLAQTSFTPAPTHQPQEYVPSPQHAAPYPQSVAPQPAAWAGQAYADPYGFQGHQQDHSAPYQVPGRMAS
ncbi:MAG: hypothetical protein AAF311_11870 [Pseudomonadota bacterium]